ncbi:autotransporter outer membrane beta-barrel domain-containing protein [Acidocella aminolytica]|uniref:autotransporter outer membrane beta-barrel domain-containing protein n=1 Tax=Acidocella aminolytica TaxID=33998 RepID=UPI0022310364|nr:autotransporter outer membrane beta-barrel domain-containing protein [Acidocella aminolytica]
MSTSDVLVTNYAGNGGGGGNGNSASLNWQSGSIQTNKQASRPSIGLFAYSIGGVGGAGGAASYGDTDYGGTGGVGGNSSNATVSMTGGSITVNEGNYNSYNAAVIALSEGGTGGAGGFSGDGVGADSGDGGQGGGAGAASASVDGTINYIGTGTGPGHAIYVESAGGQGGVGGSANALEGGAGGGGRAGAGNAASLTLGESGQMVAVTSSGKYANVAVVQSIGGGGGNGGVGNFLADGGTGATGGAGGNVSADFVNGSLVTNGAAASGLIAQSIGGGGGIGGDATGIAVGTALVVGGNGGLGGNGGNVTVQLGAKAIIGSLSTLGDNTVLAQSIGGAGGTGGSAVVRGIGAISLTIGGKGGNGGLAKNVQISNDGLVTSYGDHAAGLQAQSIGGGGGKGGAAVSFLGGILPTASIAIGGNGGDGGAAADATITNMGQVTTYGSDAYGILAQSIGGGGGSGGASAARVVSLAPGDSVPAVSFALGIGGQGGTGNTGGAASVTNSGIVTTAGEGAYALVAQSVGGGGGAGGDATAASYSGGAASNITVSFSTAIGGGGGKGAIGGLVGLDNTGLLLTYGADAYGAFAQSVGGGGTGGTGDATATANNADASFGAAISVGGNGGSGGTGGAVDAASSGGIFTTGDGADGMFAQSVGGGGGAAGGGTATANGDSLSISVGVGGSGGAGGDGGSVTASNAGAIVTRGTDADGLLAQSVGGGGGVAGKGGATAGGVTKVSNAGNLATILSQGLNLGASVTQPIAGIYAIANLASNAYDAANELYGIAAQAAGGPYEIGNATSIDVGVSVGGKGGAAGNGGTLKVDNTGEISTFGAQSDAVFAESVGGGGGKGGAASSTDSSSDDSRTQIAVGGGGNGGAGGNGGDVSVLNEAGASIETQGVLGFGILAQSVGGGGGSAGLAGTVSGSLASLSVGISGSNGSFGTGGNVDVTNDGSVTTTAKNGIGIFTQSIGGGGGLVRTMTTNETFNPAYVANNPQGRIGDVQGLSLSFRGSSNTTGNAGAVKVKDAGLITTTGRDAHAIVEQSIGGGGGAAIGGQVIAGQPTGGTSNGDASKVTVDTTAGAIISTAGDGAYGILVQSIGGGGGLGGDLANVSKVQQLAGGTNVVQAGTGSGGQITIGLTGTMLTTSGTFAPAIYAQSLGGGGGLVAENGTLYSGGAGGSGSGGDVSVTLVDSSISAIGVQSPGIVTQTNGAGGATVSIDARSSVTGGTINNANETSMAGAIYMQQGVGDTIINAGKIIGAGTVNPTAVLSDVAVQINNTGTITGAVDLGGSGSTFDNAIGGTFDPGTTINLGTDGSLVNAGKLYVGGAGTIGTTTLTGNLSNSGQIVFDADFAHGVGDALVVTGKANLTGQIKVDPVTIRNTTLRLASAAGGLKLDPALVAAPSATEIFTYRFTSDGTNLYATPVAQFTQAASGLGQAQQAVAKHLQTMFDAGQLFDAGYTAIASLASPQAYAATLYSLTGPALGGVVAERYMATNRFVSDVDGGCDTGGRSSCGWARIQGGSTSQGETSDTLGYDATYQMYETGGQTRISGRLYITGALAYEHSQLSDAYGYGHIRGDSVLEALGLRYSDGGLNIVGSVDGGYGWYTSNREVVAGAYTTVANAQPRLWNVGVDLYTSYRVSLGTRSFVKPFAELRGSEVHSSAFNEQSSSAFALSVESQGNLVMAGAFGASCGTTIDLNKHTQVKPFISAAAELSGGADWKSTARFMGDGTSLFTVRTKLPGAYGRFGIGVDLARGPNFDLVLSYDPEFGSNYTTQQGVARLTYRF